MGIFDLRLQSINLFVRVTRMSQLVKKPTIFGMEKQINVGSQN